MAVKQIVGLGVICPRACRSRRPAVQNSANLRRLCLRMSCFELNVSIAVFTEPKADIVHRRCALVIA